MPLDVGMWRTHPTKGHLAWLYCEGCERHSRAVRIPSEEIKARIHDRHGQHVPVFPDPPLGWENGCPRCDTPRHWAEKARVPVEPFRERYLELLQEGFSASELAKNLGFTRVKRNRSKATGRLWEYECGDTARLKRIVGILADNRRGRPYENIRYELAERLCREWGMDPVTAGV